MFRVLCISSFFSIAIVSGENLQTEVIFPMQTIDNHAYQDYMRKPVMVKQNENHEQSYVHQGSNEQLDDQIPVSYTISW